MNWQDEMGQRTPRTPEPLGKQRRVPGQCLPLSWLPQCSDGGEGSSRSGVLRPAGTVGTVGTRRSAAPRGLGTMAEISPEERAPQLSPRWAWRGPVADLRRLRPAPAPVQPRQRPPLPQPRQPAGSGSPWAGGGPRSWLSPDPGSPPSRSRSRPHSLPGRSLQRVPSTPPPPSMRRKKRVAEKSRRQRTSPSRCP